MQQGKQPGTGHREERHRLGESIDARPPALTHEQQHGGDKGAGVTDSDPPDEVDDRKTPRDRNIDSPDPDTLIDQVKNGVR